MYIKRLAAVIALGTAIFAIAPTANAQVVNDFVLLDSTVTGAESQVNANEPFSIKWEWELLDISTIPLSFMVDLQLRPEILPSDQLSCIEVTNFTWSSPSNTPSGVFTENTLRSIASGDSVSLSATMTYNDSLPGCDCGVVVFEETNTASSSVAGVTNIVTSDPDGPGDASNDKAVDIQCPNEGPNLRIAKEGTISANVGETISYTITVDNNGGTTAQNVSIVDTLPRELELVSISSSKGQCEGLVCDIGTLTPNEIQTVTLEAELQSVNQNCTVLNRALVRTSSSENTSDNFASHVTQTSCGDGSFSDDLALTISAPQSVNEGTSYSYSAEVTNVGDNLVNDTISVSLTNSHLQLALSSSEFSCSRDECTGVVNLQPGESNTIVGRAVSGTTTATINGSIERTDDNTSNNNDTTLVAVIANTIEYDLAVLSENNTSNTVGLPFQQIFSVVNEGFNVTSDRNDNGPWAVGFRSNINGSSELTAVAVETNNGTQEWTCTPNSTYGGIICTDEGITSFPRDNFFTRFLVTGNTVDGSQTISAEITCLGNSSETPGESPTGGAKRSLQGEGQTGRCANNYEEVDISGTRSDFSISSSEGTFVLVNEEYSVTATVTAETNVTTTGSTLTVVTLGPDQAISAPSECTTALGLITCPVNPMSIGESQSYTFEARASQTGAAVYNFVLSPDTNTSNNNATTLFNVNEPIDEAIRINAPRFMASGTNNTITLSLVNESNALDDIVYSVKLPQLLVTASPEGCVWQQDVELLSCETPPGTYSIEVTTPEVSLFDLPLKAIISPKQNDVNSNNDSDETIVTIIENADLQISALQTTPGLLPGQTNDILFVLNTDQDIDGVTVRISNRLPDGLNLNISSDVCVLNSTTQYLCTVGNMSEGDKKEIVGSILHNGVTEPTEYTVDANATFNGSDTNSANNSSTLISVAGVVADIEIEEVTLKQESGTVKVNAEPYISTQPLVLEISASGKNNPLTSPFQDLPAGPFAEEFLFDLNAVGPDIVTVTATVNCKEYTNQDPSFLLENTVETDCSNNSRSAAINIEPEYDLLVSKELTSASTITVGENATYNVTISNTGPSVSAVTTLLDTLPGTVLVGTGCENQTCSIPELQPNETYTITAIGSYGAGTHTNSVELDCMIENGETSCENNNTTATPVTVEQPVSIVINKTLLSENTVFVGEEIVYEVSVESNVDTSFSDTLSPLVDFLAVYKDGTDTSVSGLCSYQKPTINCRVAGDGVSKYTVVLAAKKAGSYTNIASIVNPSGAINNAQAENVTIIDPLVDISVHKTSSTTVAVPGQNVDFTIEVTNEGESEVTYNLIDTPSNLTLLEPLNTDCIQLNDTIECTATINADETHTYNFSGVIGSETYLVKNTAVVTALNDENTNNNSSTVEIQIAFAVPVMSSLSIFLMLLTVLLIASRLLKPSLKEE